MAATDDAEGHRLAGRTPREPRPGPDRGMEAPRGGEAAHRSDPHGTEAHETAAHEGGEAGPDEAGPDEEIEAVTRLMGFLRGGRGGDGAGEG